MREVEVGQIKAEEAARHRRELDAAREELRAEYNARVEK